MLRRYIVGTHSFLLLVAVNADWTVSHAEVLDTGHFYGIAPTADGGFIAKGGRGERLTRFVTAGRSYRAVDSWLLGDSFRYVHQIAILRDEIWVANTDHNAIDVLSLDRSGPGRRLHLRGSSTDKNHVNSVFPCGDTVFALLNNKGRIPAQVVALPARGELRESHAMSLWDTGAHNVFMDRDRLLYNASKRGHMVAVDLRRQRVERRVPFRGHTKGLSVTAQEVVLGVSDHAERRARFHSRGQLAVLARQTLDLMTMIDLNDAIGRNTGNVNEIRRIDGPDDAHGVDAPPHLSWRELTLSDSDLAYRSRFLVRRSAMDARNRILRRGRTRIVESETGSGST